MKRIPAGILLATLFLSVPQAPRLFAEESADQLADQTLGADSDNQDESAEALAKQQGVADSASQDEDESAEALAKQNGVAVKPGTDPEESAAALAKQNGVEVLPGSETDESATKLAEQNGLQKKSKKVASDSQSVYSGGEGIDGSVYAVASLPDGSTFVGGRFTSVNGQPRSNLALIKADGTLDPNFFATPDSGVDGAVYALALDANGNLLVGGFFTSAQGQPLQNFVRYLASGTLDPNFAAGLGPNGPVYAISVQANGKIVVGGQFSQIGATPRRNLARYNADGTLDTPATTADAGAGSVRSVAALTTGAVVAGGTFEIPGQTKNILSTAAQP